MCSSDLVFGLLDIALYPFLCVVLFVVSSYILSHSVCCVKVYCGLFCGILSPLLSWCRVVSACAPGSDPLRTVAPDQMTLTVACIALVVCPLSLPGSVSPNRQRCRFRVLVVCSLSLTSSFRLQVVCPWLLQVGILRHCSLYVLF